MQNKTIENKIPKDIRTIFESEGDYYNLVERTETFRENHIEYESNRRNKPSSPEDFLEKIRHYLKDFTNHFKRLNISWKTQLSIKIMFTPSYYTGENLKSLQKKKKKA